MIIKISKDIKKSSNLERGQSHRLEKKCLNLLKKNYICRCSIHRVHFPIVIESSPTQHKLVLSNQGKSIYDIVKNGLKVKPVAINEQVNCIVDNLMRCNIRHLDMNINGKNVCINSRGTISVIDFDVAVIGSDFKSTTLKDRCTQRGDYNQFKQALIKTIEKLK